MNFLRRLMAGRYGTDQLNIFLLAMYFVFWLVAMVTGLDFLSFVGMVCVILSLLRMMSRNYEARRRENAKFMKLANPVLRWFKLKRTVLRDKDHRYFKCPHCKQQLRVPRGKGKITVTCRSCGTTFQEKS